MNEKDLKMQFQYGLLIVATMFISITSYACKGQPTDKCSNYTSYSDKKMECENHYKTDNSGIGSQCYWKGGFVSGGYCLASITPCWGKKVLKKPHTH